jgi:hypothetical protein
MTVASEALTSSVSDAGRVILGAATTITQETALKQSEAASNAVLLVSSLEDPRPASSVTPTPTGATRSGDVGATASALVSSVFGGIPIVGGVQNAQAASSEGIGSVVESVVSTVLKNGFGMLPLISGLLGLFGGASTPDPPALLKYAMPSSLTFQGAETATGLGNADYDQNGMARAYGGTVANNTASTTGVGVPEWSGRSAGNGSASTSQAPQIIVNVQAMDARSFLDRSNDIAAAVRDAMLNLNSINDVVNDL